MKSLYIYEDKGTGRRSVHHLMRGLQSHPYPPSTPIKTINSSALITQSWEQETALLVFPGGRDIPYHESLKGEGNAKIRRFVEQGGQYLGICAGAYYGCSSFEFEKGSPLEIVAQRELAFYPGMARGPAYGTHQFQYESEKGAKHVPIDWFDGTVFPSYYNGGCAFPDAERYSHVEILGRYADLPRTPAAIIECRFGKGVAILSGVHPEHPIDDLSPQKQLFTLLLERLRLKI